MYLVIHPDDEHIGCSVVHTFKDKPALQNFLLETGRPIETLDVYGTYEVGVKVQIVEDED